jgi:hypothetical protein
MAAYFKAVSPARHVPAVATTSQPGVPSSPCTITARHYAIDPETGRQTHTNAELTSAAIRAMAQAGGFDLERIDVLSLQIAIVGVTVGDLLNESLARPTALVIHIPPCGAGEKRLFIGVDFRLCPPHKVS